MGGLKQTDGVTHYPKIGRWNSENPPVLSEVEAFVPSEVEAFVPSEVEAFVPSEVEAFVLSEVEA